MAFSDIDAGKLSRLHIPYNELKKTGESGGSVVNEIVDYFDGNERKYVLAKYAERYCQRITKAKNAEDDDEVYWSEPVLAAKAAVDTGKFEVVILGAGLRIKRIVASLNRSTEYKFTEEDGQDAEEFAADILRARKMAGFNLRMGRMDDLSVICGKSGMLIQ